MARYLITMQSVIWRQHHTFRVIFYVCLGWLCHCAASDWSNAIPDACLHRCFRCPLNPTLQRYSNDRRFPGIMPYSKQILRIHIFPCCIGRAIMKHFQVPSLMFWKSSCVIHTTVNQGKKRVPWGCIDPDWSIVCKAFHVINKRWVS